MALRQFVHMLVGAMAALAVGIAPQAQAQNWDGAGLLRFGVFLQGSYVDYDITQNPQGAASYRETATPNGWGVGISSGYDLRLGSFIVGVEADASFDDGRAAASVTAREQYGIDYFATVRGRLGFVISPAFMIYGTAGYGMLGAEYKLNGLSGTATGPASAKRYATIGGAVYGGGMEYDMGWGTGFVEYLHNDAGNWSFRSLQGNITEVTASHDVIRLGLKFKVGHDHSHDVYRRPDSLK